MAPIALDQHPVYAKALAACTELSQQDPSIRDFEIVQGDCFSQWEVEDICTIEQSVDGLSGFVLSGCSSSWSTGDPKDFALIRRHEDRQGNTSIREVEPSSIEHGYTLQGEPVRLWEMPGVSALAVVLTALELASESMADSSMDEFVIIRGGLVQNSPALGYFDLDELDSDLPWADRAEGVWELHEQMTQAGLPGLRQWVEVVEEHIREYGTDEDRARLG